MTKDPPRAPDSTGHAGTSAAFVPPAVPAQRLQRTRSPAREGRRNWRSPPRTAGGSRADDALAPARGRERGKRRFVARARVGEREARASLARTRAREREARVLPAPARMREGEARGSPRLFRNRPPPFIFF